VTNDRLDPTRRQALRSVTACTREPAMADSRSGTRSASFGDLAPRSRPLSEMIFEVQGSRAHVVIDKVMSRSNKPTNRSQRIADRIQRDLAELIRARCAMRGLVW